MVRFDIGNTLDKVVALKLQSTHNSQKATLAYLNHKILLF